MLRDVVLPVCDVGVLWPNSWMDQDATWYEGRPRLRRHCVRWELSSTLLPSERGTAAPPHFSAYVCYGQTVAHLSNFWAIVRKKRCARPAIVNRICHVGLSSATSCVASLLQSSQAAKPAVNAVLHLQHLIVAVANGPETGQQFRTISQIIVSSVVRINVEKTFKRHGEPRGFSATASEAK